MRGALGYHGGGLAQAVMWRAVVPALRAHSRRRVVLRSGEITVVTVNWNSSPFLAVLIGAVRRHSPPDVEILVVDNGSRDGSREVVSGSPGVRLIRLPFNAGHDLALDIGFLSVGTEYVVALDVDAFPLHDRWLDELLRPLSSGYEISGARLNRQYVHPCCLAMRTERFVRCGHSFRARYRPRTPGGDASGEVGEEIAAREHGRLFFFEPTSRRGPSDVGTVFGDLVYHNFYSTRFTATPGSVLDEVVREDDAAAAWDEALSRYGLKTPSQPARRP